ncbi:MAG: response regulator transcription factor [Cyclobacteriaceae bacterium]
MINSRSKILLVEDDSSLGFMIKDALEDLYEVTWATDGNKAWEAFSKNEYDLCLLDVMLPYKSGFEIAESIRNINKEVPILFVSARAMEEDRINGFLKGGDDYITKPFSMEELKHRVAVFLKRRGHSSKEKSETTIGKYRFKPDLLLLSIGDETRKLTRKEGNLLFYLCGKSNEVIKREDILMAVWGKDDYFTGRSLDVFISKLRKYLSDDPQIRIENYHGVGFLFKVSDS